MFLGSEGWVHVDRSRMDAHPKSLLTAKTAPGEVHLFKSDNHHVNFIDAVKGRTKPAARSRLPSARTFCATSSRSRSSSSENFAGTRPARLFVNDDEANRMLDRPMRAPWKLA